MVAGNTFLHFKPSASQAEKSQDRSDASKHITRTISAQRSKARVESLQRSFHRTTRLIAAAPGAVGRQTVEDIQPWIPAVTDCITDLDTTAPPVERKRKLSHACPMPKTNVDTLPTTVIANGAAAAALQTREIADILTFLHLKQDTELYSTSSATETLRDHCRSLAFLCVCSSIVAKEASPHTHAYQASLDMRGQALNFIRQLIDHAGYEDLQPLCLLPVYGLFKMECIEGDLEAAQCHAKALEALFESGICRNDILRQALLDDVRFTALHSHKTLLDISNFWFGPDHGFANDLAAKQLHPGITYAPLMTAWVSLRDIAEDRRRPRTSTAYDSTIDVIVWQGKLHNIWIDLNEDIAFADDGNEGEKMIQAALTLALRLLSQRSMDFDTATDEELLLCHLQLTIERHRRAVSGFEEFFRCRKTIGEAFAFALLVGSVHEQQIGANDRATSGGGRGGLWFTRNFSDVATMLGLHNAVDVQRMAGQFWMPSALSCSR